MKTVNIVLLREQLLSPNINSLQYLPCYECHENKNNNIKTQTQTKTPHAKQGYNYHQSMIRDIFLLGI